MHTNDSDSKAVFLWRWAGRILAGLLFLFWGGFFVEHLVEWFIRPLPQTPPPAVWLGQIEHLAILLGLIALWRWEVPGALVVLVAAFAFFVDKAGHNFPLFFGVTALPALMILWCAWRRPLERRRVSGGAVA